MRRSFRGVAARVAFGLWVAVAVPATAQAVSSATITGTAGNSLHYLDAGKGQRTILFIPGFLGEARNWRHQLAHFSKAYRVIAVDPRGQGQSVAVPGEQAPADRVSDYVALLRHLKVERPVIVGWSMACGEALSLHEALAGKVEALVCVDGFPGTSDAKLIAQTESWMDWAVANPEKFIKASAGGYFSKTADPALSAEVEAGAAKVKPEIAREIMVSHTRLDRRPIIKSLKVPTLFIGQGLVHTPFFPDAFKAAGRPIEAHYLEGMGHGMMLEAPGRFNAVLERFLGSLASQGGLRR